MIVVIALGSWVPFARGLAETKQISELEYIEAVRVIAVSNIRILSAHPPERPAQRLVLFTFAIGTAIVMESDGVSSASAFRVKPRPRAGCRPRAAIIWQSRGG